MNRDWDADPPETTGELRQEGFDEGWNAAMEHAARTADSLVASSPKLVNLYTGLAGHIDAVFEEHRLAYAFKDEDNADDRGKVPTVFVCVCKEGYERQGFNRHLRRVLRAPFLEFLGQQETEMKALVE